MVTSETNRNPQRTSALEIHLHKKKTSNLLKKQERKPIGGALSEKHHVTQPRATVVHNTYYHSTGSQNACVFIYSHVRLERSNTTKSAIYWVDDGRSNWITFSGSRNNNV